MDALLRRQRPNFCPTTMQKLPYLPQAPLLAFFPSWQIMSSKASLRAQVPFRQAAARHLTSAACTACWQL